MKTHLLSQLRGLQRYAAQQGQIISMPERVMLARRDLAQAEAQLEDTAGRSVSDIEIADATGLSLKQIAHIRRAKSPVNTGSILDREGAQFSPASTIPGMRTPQAQIWETMIYHDLGNTDRVIMDFTLGLRGSPQLSNRDIAQRLGITAGAVSQRKAKIQAMLDEQYELM